MGYNSSIDYNKKIKESMTKLEDKIAKKQRELERLKHLCSEMKKVQEYSTIKIMPLLCRLLSEIENREFTWGKEYFFYSNPNHPAYADIVDVVYLIGEGTDFDQYSYDGKICRALAPNGVEDYWNGSQDFIKVVYRNLEVKKGPYLAGGYPRYNGSIDFSRNNRIASHEWGIPTDCSETPFFSSLANPNYPYLLDFIRYCSYSRMENNFDQRSLYGELEGLVPSFVEEYKRTREKND